MPRLASGAAGGYRWVGLELTGNWFASQRMRRRQHEFTVNDRRCRAPRRPECNAAAQWRAATVREELDAATPLRRPERPVPGSARLRTIRRRPSGGSRWRASRWRRCSLPRSPRCAWCWPGCCSHWSGPPSPASSAAASSPSSCLPPRPGGIGSSGARRSASVPAPSTRQEELCDLDRVERGALAQVVARHEQAETVGTVSSRRRRPTKDGSRPAACSGVGRSASTTPGAPASTSRAASTVTGPANSALIASEWPVYTGTRTHVAETASSRQLEDLAGLVAELLLLVGLARPVVDQVPGERHDVVGDRRRELRRRRALDRGAVEGQLRTPGRRSSGPAPPAR